MKGPLEHLGRNSRVQLPFQWSCRTPSDTSEAICQGLEDDTDAEAQCLQTLVAELSRFLCGDCSEALEYEIHPGVPLVVELDEAVVSELVSFPPS